MNPTPEHHATAEAILRRLKAVVPHKLPRTLSQDTTDVWARMVASKPAWPALVWRDAVDFYLANMADHLGLILPKDILQAAQVVISRYERNPQVKALIEQARMERQQRLDDAIEQAQKHATTSRKEHEQ